MTGRYIINVANPGSQDKIPVSNGFDTVNAGPKTEAASYTRIASKYPEIEPKDWLFLTDNLKEVEAAREAGMQSLPVSRPGNAPLPPDDPLAASVIQEFDGLGTLVSPN